MRPELHKTARSLEKGREFGFGIILTFFFLVGCYKTIHAVQPGEVWVDKDNREYKIIKILGKGSSGEVYQVECLSGCARSKQIQAMKFARPIRDQKNNLILSGKDSLQFYGSPQHRKLMDSNPSFFLNYEPTQEVWLKQHAYEGSEFVVRSTLAKGTFETKKPERLSEDQRIIRSDLLFLAGQGALLALHSNNLVHGDIKPSNYFLLKSNNIMGAQARLGDLDSVSETGTSKVIMFTPSYAAPERLHYQQRLSNVPSEDLFSQAQSISHELFRKPLLLMYFQIQFKNSSVDSNDLFSRGTRLLLSNKRAATDFESFVNSKLRELLPPTTELDKEKERFLESAFKVDPVKRVHAVAKAFPETFGKAYQNTGLLDKENLNEFVSGEPTRDESLVFNLGSRRCLKSFARLATEHSAQH